MKIAAVCAILLLATPVWAQTPTQETDAVRVSICLVQSYDEMPDEIRRRHSVMKQILEASGLKPDCRSCIEPDETVRHVCYAPRTTSR